MKQDVIWNTFILFCVQNPSWIQFIVFDVDTDIVKDFDGESYRGFIDDVDEDADNGVVLMHCIMYCPRTVIGDGKNLNVVEREMTDEYLHKIESGEWRDKSVGNK